VFFTAFFILQRLYFPTQILQQSVEVQTLSNQTGAQKQELNDMGVEEQQSKERIKVPEVVQDRNIMLKVPFVTQAKLSPKCRLSYEDLKKLLLSACVAERLGLLV